MRATLIALLLVLTPQVATAELILDVGPGGIPLFAGGAVTAGWEFTVVSPITIAGMGIFDFQSDGIGASQDVGLWNSDGSMLLASTTITNASSTRASNGDGQWLFEAITPLTLGPGTYVLGSTFDPLEPTAQFNTAFTTIPEITYVQARIDNGGNPNLTFPGDPFSSGVFGPTLVLGQAVPIPEPASIAIWTFFGIGLAGLSYRRFRQPGKA